MNADELPEMDPYEEVTQQGQAHPLSLAYVPDPMELDEHVEDDDDDPEEDPEKDPSEEHEPEDDDKDPEEDPNEEHESKGSDETEPFKEDKIVVTPPLSRHRGARISIRPQTPMAASTQALIDAFSSGSSPFPLPPTSHAYDQAQLGRRAAMIHKKDDILVEDMPPRRIFALTGPSPGCDVAESSAAAAVRAPRSQYDFVDTVEAGQGLIRSPGHDTRTIARAADRAEDASYVRRQESKNFYTQLLDAKTDRKDIRLEIDVVRGQRIAYETELQEVHQAYLSSEARNKELLARLETLETYKSRMEIMPVTRQGTNDAMTPESIQAMIDRAIQRNSTPTQDDVSQSSGEGLRRPVQPARVCSYTNFMKCQPLNFKGTEGVVRLSQWLEKMESVFYISGCAVDNQVKFATCTLLGAALT
nr:reverse transcriptase domain-containing protein [Tanacetum cinerariifolium]